MTCNLNKKYCIYFFSVKPSAPPLPEEFEAFDNPAQMTESNMSTLEEKNNPAQKRVTFSLEDSTRGEAELQGASPLEQLLRDCSYEQVRNKFYFHTFMLSDKKQMKFVNL